MKTKRILSLLLALVLLLSVTIPAAADDLLITPKPTAEDLSQQLAELAAQYGGASALSYAVAGPDLYISGSTGVFSKTENRALTYDAMYGIGSVSKTFTATAIMQLVEKGKINLDAPVTRYLPDFKMADLRYTQITVRMLLNHSSGLMGGSTYDAFNFNDPNQDATTDLLNRLATQRLKSKPGEIAVYCNDGFTLAELVVEAVSGVDFNTYLRDEICNPTLSRTLTPQTVDPSLLVKTYQTPASTRPLAADMLGIVGCGGIYSCAMDLANFGVQLTDGTLLSQASQDAMANDEYRNGIWPEDDLDSMAYGLGWDSVRMEPFHSAGIQALTKGGDTLYYHAGLVVIPEYNLAAAVLSSGGAGVYNQMAAAQMLVAVLEEQGVSVNQEPPAAPPATPAANSMPSSLVDYSGYYGNLMQLFQITVDKSGTMTLHMANDPSIPDQTFTHFSDGSFRDPSGQAVLKFVKESNGQTYLYQKTISPIPGLGYMPMSQYVAQRLEGNAITPELQESWEALSMRPFLPVNLKYTNQIYFALNSGAPGAMPEPVPGYITGLKIINDSVAQSVYQIPNGMGRDSQDMTRFTKDGIDYYTSTQGAIYRAYEDLKDVYTGGSDKAICTIQEDGYARWYSVAEKDAGKNMTVSIQGDGGFTCYDGAGNATASTAAYGDTTATLTKDGALVFAGEPGTRFTLTFTK